MKKLISINREEVNKILQEHSQWLGKKGGAKADLYQIDLKSFDLKKKVDLSWSVIQQTDLSGSDLRGAKLMWADLRGSYLSESDLRAANLRGTNLTGANCRGVVLEGADLQGVNLHGADLRGADLRCVDLQWANLCGANLCGADLSGANLRGVNMSSANLHGAQYDNYTVWPASPMLLLAQWGAVSDELCTDLMRYEVANAANPSYFDHWIKNGGGAPYDPVWGRSAGFKENAKLYSPGPASSALNLVQRLLSEKCIKKQKLQLLK